MSDPLLRSFDFCHWSFVYDNKGRSFSSSCLGRSGGGKFGKNVGVLNGLAKVNKKLILRLVNESLSRGGRGNLYDASLRGPRNAGAQCAGEGSP